MLLILHLMSRQLQIKFSRSDSASCTWSLQIAGASVGFVMLR